MPEQLPKISQSASPVARSGAGDISERELSRERHNLQTTPPANKSRRSERDVRIVAGGRPLTLPTPMENRRDNINRLQPAHPKKQLFSVPISKFTAKTPSPNQRANLLRLRHCLDEYENRTPARPVKIGPKAVSMEDLTPTKRFRKEIIKADLPEGRSPGLHSVAEEQAAAKVCRFMLLACWRRRRDEVRCLRKTLEFQVNGSERLRMQVSALKSLLDSDNMKVRLAMRELDRLKQLLRDKDLEKSVLEREKYALENDICAAEDRASEMSIGWRNCRNELDGVRASAAVTEHALSLERAAASEARLQRDHAYTRLAILEEDLATHEELLAAAEEDIETLRRENAEKQLVIDQTNEKLKHEQLAHEHCSRECVSLSERVSAGCLETCALQAEVCALQARVARLDHELHATRDMLDWWPRPLTKMLGTARQWFRYPVSFPEAVLWSLVPARHGC